MIAKMKRLSLLVFHKEYDQFLEQLRELGVVHIAERQRGEMDAQLQQVMQKRTKYGQVLHEMTLLGGESTSSTPGQSQSPEVLIANFEQLKEEKQILAQQLSHTDKQLEQLSVWGNFDWRNFEKIAQQGWMFHFYTCADRAYDVAWEEQYNAIIISQQGGRTYFITLTKEAVTLDVEELKLPKKSLTQLAAEKSDLEVRVLKKEAEIALFCQKMKRPMEGYRTTLEGEIDLLKVRLNSEAMAEGAVVLLEGWIPQANEPELTTFLKSSGAYYELRKTTKGDNAPIKLKNNAFVRMYEVLTSMYGMPTYGEFDPTPLLAPFFTLFFGFCMADAGYGVVLILLGFLLKAKLSKSMAGMMNLVITLGVATTLIGAVLGTFFGVNLFDLSLPAWMQQFMIGGKVAGSSYDKQMVLALVIGVVHISIAMTVKAIVATVRYGFKESLSQWGWLLLVVGSVIVGTLQLTQTISQEVSTWAFIAVGSVAAIGIYLLNNLRRNLFMNIGAGLWDTYNMVTGLMGDILSYIRLYALGLAGAMLGGVFNELGLMVQEAAGGIPGWLLCGVVLIFGHSLNIAMSCLSAFVHPLRLTFVEYFKNSGYEGKGEAYKPFSVVGKAR